MDIKLNKLAFKNFKGIKELEIDFSKITNIYGENATGKTSVFDGFCWLLFDKDSKGRSKFEVQTLDSDNNRIHGLEHQVVAELEVNNVGKVLTKTLKEKWVKQRGQAEAELKGTVTNYEIDGVPTSLKDYQAFINSIINEELFKMLTNPSHFPNMSWQKQREILLEIVGDVEEDTVINYNSNLEKLRALLSDGIDNFNKRTKTSISKLKEQVKSLPYRIDECNNSIVEVDAEALEFRKRGVVTGINSLEEQIADTSKANEEKIKLQDKLFELKRKENDLKVAAEKERDLPLRNLLSDINLKQEKAQELERVTNADEFEIKRINKVIEDNAKEIEVKQVKQEKLRKEWAEINSKVFEFDANATICPCCARPFEIDKIDKIKADALELFTKNKQNKLLEIQEQGRKLSVEITIIKDKLQELEEKICKCEENIRKIKEEKELLFIEVKSLEKKREGLNSNKEVQYKGADELKEEIKQVQADIEAYKSSDTTEFKTRKSCLQEELEEINKQLSASDNNNKLKERIEVLKREEKDLNIKIAELEGQQYLAEEFIKTKVELLEKGINESFSGKVTFKLFNQQVNGGIAECCEALVNGVPYGNVNTAGQINAGLSIIKTLCKHYNVQAPIFIDNKESVNTLVDLDNQIINLIVSDDKKMKVEV